MSDHSPKAPSPGKGHEEPSSGLKSVSDWVLSSLLFLDPNAPPFGSGTATSREADNKSKEQQKVPVKAAHKQLFPCDVTIGGRTTSLKVKLESKTETMPPRLIICASLTNEVMRSLDMSKVVKGQKESASSLFLDFAGAGDITFRVLLQFNSPNVCILFCEALKAVTDVTVETTAAAITPVEVKKKPVSEIAPRCLVIFGNGVIGEKLTVGVTTVGMEAEEDSLNDFSDLNIERRTSLFPFESVQWFISVCPGGIEPEFSTVPNWEGKLSLKTTSLMAARYVQVKVKLLTTVKNNLPVWEGPMKVAKGPILPSALLTKSLLDSFSKGSSVIKLSVKVNQLSKMVMGLGQKVPSAAGLTTALNRLKAEQTKDLECEMLVTNLGFQLAITVPGLPVFRKVAMRWDQCLFVIPDPVDSTGKYIEILAQDLAYTLNLSFLSADGENWETMTIQCLNPQDRDLLFHTSLFFFINRKDHQQKFYKWAEDKQAGNYNDLQEEFRQSWIAFDWESSGELVEPCAMWSGEVDEEIARPPTKPKATAEVQKKKQKPTDARREGTDIRREVQKEEESEPETAKLFASAPQRIEKARTVKDVSKADSGSEMSEDELDRIRPT